MKKLSIALMVALLISCELIVDVEVPFEEEQVTANSLFSPDSLWSVQLNLTRNILDEEPFKEIHDAQVVVLEGDHQVATLTHAGHGLFRSDTERPAPGKAYTLSVRAPGYSDVQASASIPIPSPITGVDVYESTSNQNTMLKVTLKDDGAEANYYELYMDLENERYDFQTKQLEIWRHRLQLISEDPAIQTDDDSYSNSIIFKDALFNGREVDLTFRTAGGGISRHGMSTITLKTLSEDAYNYIRTSRLQDMTSGDPFAQPVNVYNNIQNGFGIFAGYSASVHVKNGLKPVIASIEPLTGKAGDHIIITGENFIGSQEVRVNVLFPGMLNPISGEIVDLTSTRIEVIVPDMAVTGRVVVLNGRIGVSDSDFVVTE
jgi:hypothetical protein